LHEEVVKLTVAVAVVAIVQMPLPVFRSNKAESQLAKQSKWLVG